MNKLRSLVAAIATIIILASFITVKAIHVAPKQSTYYWYNVNASGAIVAGSEAYGGTQRTVTYAQSNLPCTPGSAADCVRGFTNQIASFPSTATGDVTPLKKSN